MSEQMSGPNSTPPETGEEIILNDISRLESIFREAYNKSRTNPTEKNRKALQEAQAKVLEAYDRIQAEK